MYNKYNKNRFSPEGLCVIRNRGLSHIPDAMPISKCMNKEIKSFRYRRPRRRLRLHNTEQKSFINIFWKDDYTVPFRCYGTRHNFDRFIIKTEDAECKKFINRKELNDCGY